MRFLIGLSVLCVACNIQDTSMTGPDAGALPATATPDSDVITGPACWVLCPGQEWVPWYENGMYVWSYCLPSYQRCSQELPYGEGQPLAKERF